MRVDAWVNAAIGKVLQWIDQDSSDSSKANVRVKEQGAIGWIDDGTPQGMISVSEKENFFYRNARQGRIKRDYTFINAKPVGTHSDVATFTIPAGKKGYVISLTWCVSAGTVSTVWLNDGVKAVVGAYLGGGSKSWTARYDGAWELGPGTYHMNIKTDAIADISAEYVYLEVDA